MLELEQVETYYGKVQALKGITIRVEERSIVALLGANGAGKSTTLRTISGLIPPRCGAIRFLGERIEAESPERIVRKGIGHVPEGRDLFHGLTVYENLAMGAYTRRDPTEIQRSLSRVYAFFPILRNRERQYAGTLSGGEQQMLAIGRALMSNPRLILLDEPSLGLAPLMVREIFRIIQEINREGTTILLVEQNAHMALRVAQFGYVLETGRVVLQNRSELLLEDQRIKEKYLGTRR
jgi:branched-chain amino acid transport system ATP-binding protein